MLHNKTIAVIVPAYNEEKQIGFVIETMPEFVDHIIVINDYSTDNTADIVEEYMINEYSYYSNNEIKFNREVFNNEEVLSLGTKDDCRIKLINHKENKGKGGAIITGYNYCLSQGYDCIATMDGDGQMDPDELYNICAPNTF